MISARSPTEARARASRPVADAPSFVALYHRFHRQELVPQVNVRFSCSASSGGSSWPAAGKKQSIRWPSSARPCSNSVATPLALASPPGTGPNHAMRSERVGMPIATLSDEHLCRDRLTTSLHALDGAHRALHALDRAQRDAETRISQNSAQRRVEHDQHAQWQYGEPGRKQPDP